MMFKGSSYSDCIYDLFTAIRHKGQRKIDLIFLFGVLGYILILFISNNSIKQQAVALGEKGWGEVLE